MSKFSFPQSNIKTKGIVKELSGSIINPQRAHLAIVFLPVSLSGEHKDEVHSKVIKVWAKVRQDYKMRYVTQDNFKLGEIVMTAVAPDIWICQGICLDLKGKLDKEAATKCISKLVETAKYDQGYVHVSNENLKPFAALKKALTETVSAAGVNLFFYTAPEELIKR